MPLTFDNHFNTQVLRTAIINSITATVGVGLLLNRHRNAEIPVRAWPVGRKAPHVRIIIPTRDEERNLPDLLATLLAQQYPEGRWGISVVDDASSDRTFAIAGAAAATVGNVSVVKAGPLPDGWTGKNHALYTGLLSTPDQYDWLLFVDADTRHIPMMLSSVMQRALESGTDMLSLIIAVDMDSFWERVLVPQVGELYTLLVGTMDQVNKEDRTAAANGQFILIKKSTYKRVAALPEVRSDVAEDRALAAAVKARGGKVRLEYGRSLVRARVYTNLGDMWNGYSKTLFWASGHKTGRALLVGAALAMYALLPLAVLAATLLNRRRTAAQKRGALHYAAAQIAPMLALRAYVCRTLGVPAVYALTYPLAVLVGDFLLLNSVYSVLSGRGVQWKGRTYR